MAAMKRRALVVILIASMSMTACSSMLFFDVTNNSGADLELVTFDTIGLERHYSVSKNEVVRILLPKTMRIHGGTVDWYYDVHPAPIQNEYAKSEGVGHVVEKLQIQNDGTIYCLRPDSGSIENIFPRQPQWFPLIPIKPATKAASPK
jgi:hypothetical protein